MVSIMNGLLWFVGGLATLACVFFGLERLLKKSQGEDCRRYRNPDDTMHSDYA